MCTARHIPGTCTEMVTALPSLPQRYPVRVANHAWILLAFSGNLVRSDTFQPVLSTTSVGPEIVIDTRRGCRGHKAEDDVRQAVADVPVFANSLHVSKDDDLNDTAPRFGARWLAVLSYRMR